MNSKTTTAPPWWRGTTIYQIYPRSFQDSNGDGIGDIPGILHRLDYLEWLGVETLWLSPVYPGPQKDFGYDIADFRGIDPSFGSMEDLDRLIEELHRRKMKLVMDMVLNHTSDAHPWFRESAASLDNPRRNWYVWKDGRGARGEKPPNNWQSQVSGSGWHRHEATGQWYWASFLPFQPDLNWRNPEVEREMMETLRFWLDRGVDGFRLDILGSVFETEGFPDNPRNLKLFPENGVALGFFHSCRHTSNHPDNFALARRLRTLTESYDPARFLVGEVFGHFSMVKNYCGREKNDGLHSVFLFHAPETPFRPGPFKSLQRRLSSHFTGNFQGCLALSNHDRIRRISGIPASRARLSALWQMTGRSIPCLYYGEEIGMPQGRIPGKQAKDPIARPFQRLPEPVFRRLARKLNGAIHRDNCRLPMIWKDQAGCGFTTAPDPWLPFSPLPSEGGVEEQKENPESLLHFHRRLIHLRRNSPVLSLGTEEPLEGLPRKVAGWVRRWEGEEIRIFLNFGESPVPLPGPIREAAILLSTRERVTESAGREFLMAGEGIVVQVSRNSS
jgi:alpha-glucosidase